MVKRSFRRLNIMAMSTHGWLSKNGYSTYYASATLASPSFLLISLHRMMIDGGMVTMTPTMATIASTEIRDIVALWSCR